MDISLIFFYAEMVVLRKNVVDHFQNDVATSFMSQIENLYNPEVFFACKFQRTPPVQKKKKGTI